MVTENISGPINCACVIHGNAYSWEYVDRLYNMLSRNLSAGVTLHVYTESERAVPAPYIKHTLTDWGLTGPKRAWWYKIQLFNPEQFRGPLLYFDLDTVIVDNIDWITQLPTQYFWTVRDFKHLWEPTDRTVNSSIMWWHTAQFENVWRHFTSQNLHQIVAQHRGDQDFITDAIIDSKRRFFDQERVKSWRWQCFDGGYNFDKKRHITPGTGTAFLDPTSVLIFHGNPKPADVTDSLIVQHWR